jgi:hypothetical protein
MGCSVICVSEPKKSATHVVMARSRIERALLQTIMFTLHVLQVWTIHHRADIPLLFILIYEMVYCLNQSENPRPTLKIK